MFLHTYKDTYLELEPIEKVTFVFDNVKQYSMAGWVSNEPPVCSKDHN